MPASVAPSRYTSDVSARLNSVLSQSFESSPLSSVTTWKSPVLLFQGDDDRNVQFSQLTGLVQLLRAHNVYHEIVVYTDDTHEPLLHRRYLYGFNRLEEFISRYLKGTPARSTAGGQ